MSSRDYSKEIDAASARLDAICDSVEKYESLDASAKIELDKEIDLFCEVISEAWIDDKDVLTSLTVRGIDSREPSVHSYFQALGSKINGELDRRVVTHPKSVIRSALGVFPTATQTLDWFEARNRN